MKKLLTLTMLFAFTFATSIFAAEVSVDDCGAYAESSSRANVDIAPSTSTTTNSSSTINQ